jgi:hypothetical protein
MNKVFPLLLLNPSRFNPNHADTPKEKGKCHQETFLALPITTELTAVGTLHSALAPHVNCC